MRILALSGLLWLVSVPLGAAPVDVKITRADGLSSVHHGQSKKAPNGKGPSITIDGTLALAHADYGTGSEWYFELRDAKGKRTAINVDSLPEEVHNAKVRLKGRANGKGVPLAPDVDAVDPSEVTVLAPASAPLALTNVTVLVAQIQYSNSTANPVLSTGNAAAVMNDVANFYAKNSYGKESMSYTYAGLVTIASSLNGSCDWQGVMSKGPAALKAANPAWDTTKFTYTVYVMPNGSCGWLGLGYVGSGPSFIAGAGVFIRQVVAHENGHNHGLLHCGSVASPGGGVAEYGDRYCTMGNDQGSGHFNAYQKLRLGYIPTSSVKTVAAGSPAQSFDLTPIEQSGGALYAVKITTNDANVTYWLEDRAPLDYDAFRVGSEVVQVRTSSPFKSSTGSDDTQLVTSAGSGGNLAPGATYADMVANLSVQVGGGSPPPPPPPPPPPAGPVANASFEAPVASGPGYVYRPIDPTGAWTFSGGSGIEKNGSAWNAPNAPDGSQAAFLQNVAIISQTLTLKAASYTLSFRAARRICCASPAGVNPITVTVDGAQIGATFTPSSASQWDAVSLPFTIAADGPHTLVFSTSGSGDVSSFVDSVSVQ